MSFPLGRAPLWILVTALLTGLLLFVIGRPEREQEPDLVFVVFSKEHFSSYQKVLPEFENARGVRVEMQLVDARALASRLRAAFLAGTPVPDLVEVEINTMGNFTRGPLDDIGFVDLTDRLTAENLFERIVPARFSLWSIRGRTFALPHDVHPVMLAYRRDVVESLGIDVGTLRTWADFSRIGQMISRDANGDGLPERFALEMSRTGATHLEVLINQNGGGLFDADGNVIFDSPQVAETIEWYTRHIVGPEQIGFPAGTGQNLAKALIDGLILFAFAPDWRTRQFQVDVPSLSGKMALMPLPRWTESGRTTSTWGGTGLAITKRSPRQDLAWDLAKFLYLEKDDLAERFLSSNIIPPVIAAWSLPEFDLPNAFYSDQPLGRLFVDLAPEVPPVFNSPYSTTAALKVNEVLVLAVAHYTRNGLDGLRDYIVEQLGIRANLVRRRIERNMFLNAPSGENHAADLPRQPE